MPPRSADRAAARPRHGLLIGVGVATAAAVVALAIPAAMGGDSGHATSTEAATSAVTDSAVKVKSKPRSSASPSAKASAKPSTSADSTPSSDSSAKPSKQAEPAPETKPAPLLAADDPTPPQQILRPGSDEPIPATESSYAKNIPDYPPDGRTGRRIVYSKALMHVWIVNSDDEVVRSYPVTGRWDRPLKGVYKIYSMSDTSENQNSKVTFRHMVRFAWGMNDESASIGFHSIPIYYADNPERGAKKGDRMTTKYELGLPVSSGGCIRQSDEDAEFLYRWSEVGDVVVVLPTAD